MGVSAIDSLRYFSQTQEMKDILVTVAKKQECIKGRTFLSTTLQRLANFYIEAFPCCNLAIEMCDGGILDENVFFYVELQDALAQAHRCGLKHWAYGDSTAYDEAFREQLRNIRDNAPEDAKNVCLLPICASSDVIEHFTMSKTQWDFIKSVQGILCGHYSLTAALDDILYAALISNSESLNMIIDASKKIRTAVGVTRGHSLAANKVFESFFDEMPVSERPTKVLEDIADAIEVFMQYVPMASNVSEDFKEYNLILAYELNDRNKTDAESGELDSNRLSVTRDDSNPDQPVYKFHWNQSQGDEPNEPEQPKKPLDPNEPETSHEGYSDEEWKQLDDEIAQAVKYFQYAGGKISEWIDELASKEGDKGAPSMEEVKRTAEEAAAKEAAAEEERKSEQAYADKKAAERKEAKARAEAKARHDMGCTARECDFMCGSRRLFRAIDQLMGCIKDIPCKIGMIDHGEGEIYYDDFGNPYQSEADLLHAYGVKGY
ncbi:MAG: hypothetical protein RSC43_00205 [Clostridia bacterium]